MANPSTDGPTSANGTEILRRAHGNPTSTSDVKLIEDALIWPRISEFKYP